MDSTKRTITTSKHSYRRSLDFEERQFFDNRKIKTTRAYKLNVNCFQNLNHNVKPFESNYLAAKLRRIKINKEEKHMLDYTSALIKSKK